MSKDLTIAQICEEVEKAQRMIEAHESTKKYWLAELNRQVVLANEVINGKTETLWGWKDEVR
jgi:hypothetical protein